MAEKPRSSTDSLRHFTTEHDRLITTFGAMLVVAAFYVQDLKLPPIEKKMGAIEAAKTESADIGYLNAKIDDLGERIADGLAPGNRSDALKDIHDTISAATHDFDADQDDLSISQNIAARLPNKVQELKREGTGISARVEALRKQEAQVLDELGTANLTAVTGSTDVATIPGYERLLAHAGPFAQAATQFHKDVTKFHEDVSSETGAQSDSLSRQSERWEHISEFLVIVGFLASTIGKLLKIPALDKAD